MLLKTLESEAIEQEKQTAIAKKKNAANKKSLKNNKIMNFENPEEEQLVNSDEEEVEIEKEIIPEAAFDGLKKKKTGSSEVVEIPRVSKKQYLAPFCSNKYPQLIVSILPEHFQKKSKDTAASTDDLNSQQ